ncbi:MAG: hypothetical protein AB7P76_11890 [Candidatus Melainabacteria bacterium]
MKTTLPPAPALNFGMSLAWQGEDARYPRGRFFPRGQRYRFRDEIPEKDGRPRVPGMRYDGRHEGELHRLQGILISDEPPGHKVRVPTALVAAVYQGLTEEQRNAPEMAVCLNAIGPALSSRRRNTRVPQQALHQLFQQQVADEPTDQAALNVLQRAFHRRYPRGVSW